MLASRPFFHKNTQVFIKFLQPDLVLTQSKQYERIFKKYNCNVTFFPNGVDCKKFIPVKVEQKLILRRKHGIPINKKIILHVGHIKENRHLRVLIELQKFKTVQVVVVTGYAEKIDLKLFSELLKSNILIFNSFFPDISDFYKLSDCYIFPIKQNSMKLPDRYNQIGAIDFPLSVLEAMACNIAVVTTSFGAMKRIFQGGDGLYYCDTIVELVNTARDVTHSLYNCNNREKVLSYDWDMIIKKLENVYLNIIKKSFNYYFLD